MQKVMNGLLKKQKFRWVVFVEIWPRKCQRSEKVNCSFDISYPGMYANNIGVVKFWFFTFVYLISFFFVASIKKAFTKQQSENTKFGSKKKNL